MQVIPCFFVDDARLFLHIVSMKTTKRHSSKKVAGFSFYELLAKFPTEESIISYFIQSRYGKTITCPYCGEKHKIYNHSKGAKFFFNIYWNNF
jgi:hypothetical protein